MLKLTVTNEQGEVYTSGPVTQDQRGRWCFTDDEGDVYLVSEILNDAVKWQAADWEYRGITGQEAVTSALFLLSCGATTVTQGENWLASKTDKPEMDVWGTWTSPEWGAATFKQDGKNVTGVLGDYPARGVVSGNVLYLMMYAGEKADYLAELKATDLNNFNGVYSKYKPVDEVRKEPGYTKPMSRTKGVPK